MIPKSMYGFAAASALLLSALAQPPLVVGPPQSENPEIVAGPVRAITSRADRTAVLKLVERARAASLRGSAKAYDLRLHFTVNSGGQTKYDGVWQMEEIYDPQLGLRWSANLAGSYSITRISSHGMLYGNETDSYVPLRLHEVRAALFDPFPSKKYVSRASLRTRDTIVDGQQLTCALLSGGGNRQNPNAHRGWNESEDCIDPESGFLRIHSSAPGRYYAYDYSDSLAIGGRLVPRNVTVHEAGRVVTTISVDSLTELPGADPALFVPTEEMKARGRPIHLGLAEKLFRISRVSAAGGPPGTVCVFGVVTSSGQLMEAHSLQPTSPNSQAALEAAQQMNFSHGQVPAGHPEQHFVFVIRRFVPSP